jgi:hypothetical protein
VPERGHTVRGDCFNLGSSQEMWRQGFTGREVCLADSLSNITGGVGNRNGDRGQLVMGRPLDHCAKCALSSACWEARSQCRQLPSIGSGVYTTTSDSHCLHWVPVSACSHVYVPVYVCNRKQRVAASQTSRHWQATEQGAPGGDSVLQGQETGEGP